MILSLPAQIPTVYLESLHLLQFPDISGRPIRCSSENQKIKETDAVCIIAIFNSQLYLDGKDSWEA